MKLFTIGPVEMYPHTFEIRKNQIPYFRTNDFSMLNLETDKMLKELLSTAQNSKVIYLTASGTAAMEAAVMNCLCPEKDYVLVIEGGTFGKRFRQICQIHNIKHKSLILNSDEELTEEHLNQYKNESFTALLVNLHETSTGQLYNVEMLSNFCRKNGMYFIVDAISTFLCDSYAMDKYGIDVTIISSHKGLCIAPGMSMVVLNEKICNERIYGKSAKSLYFNFNDYIQNMERGQTPFTPAVGIMYELHDMLTYIYHTGLENFLNHIEEICFDFRNRLQQLPVSIPSFPLSNAITPVFFQEPVAQQIYKNMSENDNVYVNPSGGAMGEKMFRVAHVGNHTLKDNEMLIRLMKKYLKYNG